MVSKPESSLTKFTGDTQSPLNKQWKKQWKNELTSIGLCVIILWSIGKEFRLLRVRHSRWRTAQKPRRFRKYSFDHQARSESFTDVGKVWDADGSQHCNSSSSAISFTPAGRLRSLDRPVATCKLRHVISIARHQQRRLRDWLVDLSVQVHIARSNWHLHRTTNNADYTPATHANSD